MEASFDGLDPWGFGGEIIECRGTEIGNIDLHNDCRVTATEYDFLLNQVRLRFQRMPDPVVEFQIIFSGVQHLRMRSSILSSAEDRDIFHAIDYYELAENQLPMFEMTCEVVTLTLVASEIRFRPT